MKSCVFLLAFLHTIILFSQSSIYGSIVDEEDQGMLYTNVLLFTADSVFLKGAITDDAGGYEFTALTAGSYYLAAEGLGYHRVYSSSFYLQERDNYQASTLRLKTNVHALDEVTITASKPLFEQKLDRLVVNVQQSITHAGATALGVLESSPGVGIDRVNQVISLQGKNGVLVMINGKVNRLDAATLIQMLAGMPAANIDKIELITTPPANYDAEGDAGIINIILIDQQEDGWNANWTNTLGYGQRAKWGSTANAFWQTGSWSITANLSTNSDYTFHNLSIDRTNRGEDNSVLSSNLFSYRPAYIGFHNFRLGIDYQIGEKTSLGVLYATHRSDWELDAVTYSENSKNHLLQSQSELSSMEINTWNHWMGSMNLQHQFAAGEKLSLTTDYLYYFDNNPTDYSDFLVDEIYQEESLRYFRSRKETPVVFWVNALDFTHDKNDKWQWQAGLKTTLSRFENKVDLDYLIDNDWYSDENFSDVFTLNEDIYAAYWTGTLQLNNKWQLKMGGRYEYLDSRRTSERDGSLPGQRYGRLFPTLYLSNTLNEEQQWSIAYSERITRPSFNVLAPAFFFFGPNTILSGNPSILQTISRQLSAEYRYKTLQTSVRYTDDTNPIAWGQPNIDAATNILLIKAQNMMDQKTLALNLNFPLEITNWWTSRQQLSGNWLRQVQMVEQQPMTNESSYFNLNSTHSFSIQPTLSAELKAQAISPLKYGLGEIPWRYGLDLGLQKSFADGRHKINFNWTDIFDTNSFFAIETNQPSLDLYLNWSYEMEGSVKRLTYTWQFGQQSLKKVDRKSASSEEQGRIN